MSIQQKWKHLRMAAGGGADAHLGMRFGAAPASASSPMVMHYGEDGRIVDVNDAYCSSCLRPRNELLGKSFLHNVLRDDVQRIGMQVSSLNPMEPVRRVLHDVRGRDGEVRRQLWLHMAVEQAGRNGRRYLAVGRDITGKEDDTELLHKVEQDLAKLLRMQKNGNGSRPNEESQHVPLRQSTFGRS